MVSHSAPRRCPPAPAPPPQWAQGASESTTAPAGDATDPEADALAAPLVALGRLLGDRCPSASLTRAVRLLTATSLPVQEFVLLLEEAARRTLAASRRHRARRPREGKLMAYLFAVLENLLHAAPGACAPAPCAPAAVITPPGHARAVSLPTPCGGGRA